MNHGVSMVGFGMQDDVVYAVIRNSWGSGFGLNGYMHIQIYPRDVCGILKDVVMVTDVDVSENKEYSE